MAQMKIPAVFMRGGTSKAVMFHARDLPADTSLWSDIFLSALGAPDPNGRQLNGMGGGVSSVSKVCIIGPPSRPDADVDYTFAQIGVTEAIVDYGGNCGNMSSAVGSFAIDEGLVAKPADGNAVVRIHNTNTKKIIINRFKVADGEALVEGDMAIDGVAGTGAPVRVEFMSPGGSKTGKLLPTGNATDTLTLADGTRIEASLIDAANPCVFVDAEAVGRKGSELPDALDRDKELLGRLEAVRQAASVAMGLTKTPAESAKLKSIPKVAMVASPRHTATLSGRELGPDDMDIMVRMISVGQPHRAVPLTGASCLAVATRVPGSIPARLARRIEEGASQIRIAHPSGLIVVDAKVSGNPRKGEPLNAEYAAIYRTARRLFEGRVLVRSPRSV